MIACAADATRSAHEGLGSPGHPRQQAAAAQRRCDALGAGSIEFGLATLSSGTVAATDAAVASRGRQTVRTAGGASLSPDVASLVPEDEATMKPGGVKLTVRLAVAQASGLPSGPASLLPLDGLPR